MKKQRFLAGQAAARVHCSFCSQLAIIGIVIGYIQLELEMQFQDEETGTAIRVFVETTEITVKKVLIFAKKGSEARIEDFFTAIF